MRPPRHAPLLRALLAIQHHQGWLPPAEVERLARERGVPFYRVHGLATFFPVFRSSPPPEVDMAVCRDVVCAMHGGAALLAEARAVADQSRGSVAVREVSCLGQCDGAPAMEIHGTHVRCADPERVALLCGRARAGMLEPEPLGAAREDFTIDPYEELQERYGVLRERPDPEAIVAAVEESGLRGMGGAGFPAGVKWRTVQGAAGSPKYVICNADESEPGTFKDRFLLDTLAHLVVEGMLLAARAVGAAEAIVYIRHEYGRQRQSLEREFERARAAGLLGDVHVEIFTSPGGYICGEETALLEVLEDRRAEPRNKPPFPAVCGLYGKPTLINNVETFAWVPAILRRGPRWYASGGVQGYSGRKLVALSGDVNRPGVYEVPLGTPLRRIIEACGEGVRGGRLAAILPGGASSAFLPAEKGDTPLDFRALAQAGSMLGSGAVIVVAEGRDLVVLAANLMRFFRDESCGKCVPCRVGTEKAARILDEGVSGREGLLGELAAAMADASICGLGQAAMNPVLSALRLRSGNSQPEGR